MMFSGFPARGLALLGELPTMDKEQFKASKAGYVADLQGPVKAFVDGLGPVLKDEISPGIEFAAKTHGSIGPINNDVRFNPEAPTYKDHLLLRFWEGSPKKTAPTLFVRITGSEVGFAVGTIFGEMEAWREAVDRHGTELSTALEALVDATGAVVVGDDLKRVPKPFDAGHPQADLLRHKWFQARWPRPMPASVSTEDFVRFCADELALARGVHRWFVDRLG